MKNWRYVVAPPQKINCVATWDLINIRHNQQIIISYACYSEKLIKRNSLIGLFDKWVFSFPKPSADVSISQPWLNKFELLAVASKDQWFQQASERRIGFKENELCDVRVQFVPTDSQDFQLIAEQYSIKNTPWALSDPPPMKLAEVLHRYIRMVIMRDIVERFGR